MLKLLAQEKTTNNHKFEIMKSPKKHTKKIGQKIKVKVNKNLDKYANVVLFPEKLAKANSLLKGVKIP